ncbi:MAG: HK97 family phage prohead protease [bacterium]
MPWRIEQREGEFCVVKEADGSTEKCHPTRAEAERHQRALYAAEDTSTRAELTASSINDLPDSAFAYIEPGGKKDAEGKTVPRSKRHFPIHDAAHVRNALARAPQSPFGAKAMLKIKAAAQKFGIKVADDRSTPTAEIVNRAAVVADVDKRQYLIDVLAVPWNEPAQVFWRGDFWTEVFHRGAFDGVQERVGRIRVNREHTKGATVGKIVALDPQGDLGLTAQVKIVKSPAGDEIMALADQDMTSVSIGYRANKPSDVRLDKRSKRRDVYGAFLDHLSFVEDPTWDRAQVLSVREGPNGLTVVEGPLPPTPALDAILQDDVIGWAASYPYRKE